jgi:hypothetical protein
MAVPALLGAAETNSLRAALDAVYAAIATYGVDYRGLLDEVWTLVKDEGPTTGPSLIDRTSDEV